MAWRFRRTWKLAPGGRLNLGTRSAPVRVGPRGAGITPGRAGATLSAGGVGMGLHAGTRISRGVWPAAGALAALALGLWLWPG